MKPNKFLFLFLSLYIVNCTLYITHAEVRYVSKTGSSTPPYTSWATAADSIQKAINICVVGDTVIVANGVYQESLLIEQTIHLIGSSMDSTIIDGSSPTSYWVIRFNFNNSSIENFTINGPGKDIAGILCLVVWYSNITVKNCITHSVQTGISIATSSPKIENTIIKNSRIAISDLCPDDTCQGTYTNNLLWASYQGVMTYIIHSVGGSPTFKNNIIIGENSSQRGASFESQKRVVFENNLISGFQHRNVIVLSHSDSVFLENNNSMNVQEASGFYISDGNKTVVRNNIIQNTNLGVSGGNAVSSDYNLFNNVNTLVNGGAYLNEGNIIADPMFVNDTLPTINGSYDLHLQKHSPAIDKGDPNISDVDGTRSDIGMYGGPDGEKYEYLDLAPRTPRNFTYLYDTTNNFLTLNWNMNTEYDFRNYNIYRDTASGFTPNENNLIAQTDTSYFADNLSNIKSSSVYYRVTAVDSQDNESQPGNEIAVTITTGIEPGVQIIRDYILYQNYPNPFNPTTRIGYEIKERAYVKLMVYDIKGELVSVLVNKEQTAGYYEVEFSVNSSHSSVGNDLASGIYLYRIEVIGEGRIPVYSDMRKMMVLK